MEPRAPEKKRWPMLVGIAVVAAVAAAGITALLVNIIQRKTEAKQQYVRLVEVTEDTVDPKVWGTNWPREYDSYLKTVEPSRTNFGGGDAHPAQKAEQFPWLNRIFAGYAFSLDYRDRRGHAYICLLYTSDAADERSSVDLGGRRIIKKKKKNYFFFFFQAEDGIRDAQESRGLGDVYKRQFLGYAFSIDYRDRRGHAY